MKCIAWKGNYDETNLLIMLIVISYSVVPKIQISFEPTCYNFEQR